MLSSGRGVSKKPSIPSADLKRSVDRDKAEEGRVAQPKKETSPVKPLKDVKGSARAESEGSVFDYKMRRTQRDPAPVEKPAEPKPDPSKQSPVLEKPLVRYAATKEGKTPTAPKQSVLGLEAPLPRVPRRPPLREKEEAEPVPKEEVSPLISKEILFSRFLCGIIDVTLAILLSLGFGIIAAVFLGADLFTQASAVWVGFFAFVLFLFNSVFFLLSCGKTPGMYLTELKLTDDEYSDQVPMVAIILRIIIFLPVMVTLVGLFWALFDPFCRCVHDVFSGTRIQRDEVKT